MRYLIVLALLLGGCFTTVGPYCNRWESVSEPHRVKQVCREWRYGA